MSLHIFRPCEQIYDCVGDTIVPKWPLSCPKKFIPDYSNQEIFELEKFLRKDGNSCNSYLDNNEKLLEVYAQDKKTLDDAGITFDQVADVLLTMIDKYKRKLRCIARWFSDDIQIEYDPNKKKLHEEELAKIPDDIMNLKV